MIWCSHLIKIINVGLRSACNLDYYSNVTDKTVWYAAFKEPRVVFKKGVSLYEASSC